MTIEMLRGHKSWRLQLFWYMVQLGFMIVVMASMLLVIVDAAMLFRKALSMLEIYVKALLAMDLTKRVVYTGLDVKFAFMQFWGKTLQTTVCRFGYVARSLGETWCPVEEKPACAGFGCGVSVLHEALGAALRYHVLLYVLDSKGFSHSNARCISPSALGTDPLLPSPSLRCPARVVAVRRWP